MCSARFLLQFQIHPLLGTEADLHGRLFPFLKTNTERFCRVAIAREQHLRAVLISPKILLDPTLPSSAAR